jgi:NAD-dependent deacetylase
MPDSAIVRRVDDALSRAIRVLKPARRILVFSGAGISTESGIPDFRGPDGLWTRMDPEDFTIHRYLADPEIRKRSWAMHQQGFFGGMLVARPNRAHLALVPLWSTDRMAGCVTQNIDGLHQRAGLPEEAVAELHGNLRRVHCTACPASWETEEIVALVVGGDPDPTCFECGAVVKTSTVLFGELLPPEAWDLATRMAAAADAVLAIGSTLSVYPASDLIAATIMDGADLVIVNQGETAFDDLAAARVDQSAGDVLPDLIAAIL